MTSRKVIKQQQQKTNKMTVSQAEQKEMDLMTKVFNQFGITDYKFTEIGSMERYDGDFVNSKGEKIVFEIKVRDLAIDRYPTTIIEDHKYKYLLQQELMTGKIPYLFVFYPRDNKVFITRLKEEGYKVINNKGCSTTFGTNGYEKNKQFINIPITKQGTVTLQ